MLGTSPTGMTKLNAAARLKQWMLRRNSAPVSPRGRNSKPAPRYGWLPPAGLSSPGAGEIAVAPERYRFVDARELRLGCEIDSIARARDHVIEAQRLSAGLRGHLAVAGERDVGQRSVQVYVEAVERDGSLDRVERHGRHAPIAEQEVSPAHDVGQLVCELEHVRIPAVHGRSRAGGGCEPGGGGGAAGA